jgi:hypothetical protein
VRREEGKKGARGEEYILFSKTIARRVKYPMRTPKRLITILMIPKARVIDVSKDTI